MLDTWLWAATVATAVAGGILSVIGSARQRMDSAEGRERGRGYRMVMMSYVLMTTSVVIFAVRGLI